MAEDNFLSAHGVNRRDFMKLCAGMAATLGLSSNAAAEMAAAITDPQRPPVIWIGAQECTGCTESLLRATHPTIENLILNTISLEYHEVLSAAFGHQAEENKHNAMKRYKGKYVLVVDGSIPLKDGGVYCMVAGEPIVDHIRRAAADAAAVIAIGSCAAWGGVPATGGNPTGAVSLEEAIGKPVINIPGCPPNPHNFLTTVVYYITYGKLPALDSKHRPLFAYERLIHENVRTLTRVVLPKSLAITATVKAGVCITLAVKGQKLTVTAQRWSSAILAAGSGQWVSVILATAVMSRVWVLPKAFSS